MHTALQPYGIPRLLVRNTRYVLSHDPRWGWGVYDGEEPALLRPQDQVHREPVPDADFVAIGARIKIWDDDTERFIARQAARGHTLVVLERDASFAFVVFSDGIERLTDAQVRQAADAERIVSIWSWSSMGDTFVEFGRTAGDVDDGVCLLFDGPVPTSALPEGGQFSSLNAVSDVWAPDILDREPSDDEAGWPLTPTDELVARIDAHLAALTRERYTFAGHCQQHGMLPLHSTQIYTWALQSDGTIQWIDHEAFGYPAEPETRRARQWAALERGIRRYPDLAALLPLRPLDVAPCAGCQGDGLVSDEPCRTCSGFGWRFPEHS